MTNFDKMTDEAVDFEKEKKRFKKFWSGQNQKSLKKIYEIKEEQYMPFRAGLKLPFTLHFLPKVLLITSWLAVFSMSCMMFSLFLVIFTPLPDLYVTSVGGHIFPLISHETPTKVDPINFGPIQVKPQMPGTPVRSNSQASAPQQNMPVSVTSETNQASPVKAEEAK